jgi:uncharacterized membrane protein
MPLIAGLIGLGGKILDKLLPNTEKAQDHIHEIKIKQADATIEGERSKNYYTPRSLILYAMAFAVVYGVVLQPFAVAFGVNLPAVNYEDPLHLLIGLLGL